MDMNYADSPSFENEDEMDMEEVPTDDLALLPPQLRQEIDRAFDRAAAAAKNTRPFVEPEDAPRRSKRRKLNGDSAPAEDTGGGFLVEEGGGFLPSDTDAGGFLPPEEDGTPGGFVPREEEEDEGKPTHLPLSRIPFALKLLRLPPDDDEVLSTFREAATGWGVESARGSRAAERGGRGTEGETGLAVSREDWRAVCAVLLAQREDAPAELEDEEDNLPQEVPEEGGGFVQEFGEEESDLTEDEEDTWQPQEEEEAVDDSEEEEGSEYAAPVSASSRAAKGKGKGKGKGKSRARSRREEEEDQMELEELGYADLSGKKKAEVRAAFALFFDDAFVANGNGKGKGKGKEREAPPTVTRRIGASDLARVGKLLNEKISPAEVEEMLEIFGSGPDKSVGIQEFAKIMIMGNVL